ncbi:MAG: hypothetical protein KAS04_06605 [Candidatus Aenigmarchaeota archaeon]|nr:hypothetical protein [Candidatus Aenigmarchaeota archaeon]
MERKNKHRGMTYLIGLFVFAIIMINTASANSVDNPCALNASLIYQNPYPVIPNDYVELVFHVSGIKNSNCDGAWFELVPSYPFSLDEDDALRTLTESAWNPTNYGDVWLIIYKLRVDKDALDGYSEIEIKYGPGFSQSYSYSDKSFEITVQDSRTYFDAVIQEVSEGDVSIAIANTGKYIANSIVVRIPEQEGFKATGTDGQMVGNLAAGDYNIVSFTLESAVRKESELLQFDIHYTDELGERRIVNMELPLQMETTLLTKMGIESNLPKRSTLYNKQGIDWTLLIIIAIGIVIAAIIMHKGISHKRKKSKSENVPDWIKHAKDKKK